MLLIEGPLRTAYRLPGAVPDLQLFHLLPGELYVELPGGGVGKNLKLALFWHIFRVYKKTVKGNGHGHTANRDQAAISPYRNDVPETQVGGIRWDGDIENSRARSVNIS